MDKKYLNSKTLAGMQYSDEEVAYFVRMLMRDQINHEMVCTLGRDRIMLLSERLERADEIIKKLMTTGKENLLPETLQEIQTHLQQSEDHPKGYTGNKDLSQCNTIKQLFEKVLAKDEKTG